jgi:lysyl-tRNA synthetase class I
MSGLQESEQVIRAGALLALGNGREHVSDLSILGVNDAYLDSFEAKLTEAEELPSAETNIVELKHITDIKDHYLEACFDWATMLRKRIKYKFGRLSDEYDAFPSAALKEARDSERKMIQLMDTLIAEARRHAAVLSEVGQDDDFVEEGELLAEYLQEAELNQEQKKVENTADTEYRQELHRELYKMTNQINRVGRDVFKDSPGKRALFAVPWPRLAIRYNRTESEELN